MAKQSLMKTWTDQYWTGLPTLSSAPLPMHPLLGGCCLHQLRYAIGIQAKPAPHSRIELHHDAQRASCCF